MLTNRQDTTRGNNTAIGLISLLSNTGLIESSSAKYSFVKVTGQSMEPTINDNSIAIVNEEKKPRRNNVVIVSVNGQYFCKRFVKINGLIVLKSDNPGFPAFAVTPDVNFAIIGVVQGVIGRV